MSKSRQNGRFDPPTHLSRLAAALWRRLVPGDAVSTQRLTLLAHALEALDRANECRELLAESGLTVTALSGGKRAHPLIAVEATARKEFRTLWDALGLKTSRADNPYFTGDKSGLPVGLPDEFYSEALES